jgi:hypothetical protein
MAARGVRLSVAVLATLAVLAQGTSAGAQQAPAAEAPPPAQWPQTPSASPRIEGFPHAVRIAGPDRQQTSLAAALTLRGTGDFPFDTPDRSSGGAATLAAASGWWGVGRCPRAVIVVAGDSPADALAASALSDPTDRSTEPFLQRSAAADPLFDPIGGFARVDTDRRPILVTRAARQGATASVGPTRLAAQDLRNGPCDLARQAIVVGGAAAVPPGIDDELVSIGYTEVFRVSGPDRYATAAAVAHSLGTAAVPDGVSGCLDPSTADGAARMAFHANSVVELRDSATSCRLLARSVVLTDGITGADALAAGWWTSFWQVPVLLHDGSSSLPAATVAALETLDVDHVVVLGGTARLSEGVLAQAVDLTGAEAIRVSGPDRYATSVEMARRFGGWWPSGDGDGFAGSLVCVAASSGEGPQAIGWPDALGAGPWCGSANGAAANPGQPTRALAPTTGGAPTLSQAVPRPGRDAAPVLLVPAGSTTLPGSVEALLSAAFSPTGLWCSSVAAPSGCLQPGFAVVFGGSAAVHDTAVVRVSRLVAGGGSSSTAWQSPRLDGVFHTTLDLAPVFAVDGSGVERACVARGYEGLRWLATYADPGAVQMIAAADLMIDGRYLTDADGGVRSPGLGSPACVSWDTTPNRSVTARGVSLAGRATQVVGLDHGLASRLRMDGSISQAGASSTSGIASDLDPAEGGVTSWTFVSGSPGVTVVSRQSASAVQGASITVTLTRGVDSSGIEAPDRFQAVWSVDTAQGVIDGAAVGEALLDGGTWRLRGRSIVTGGTWNAESGVGGFVADIDTGAPGSSANDSIAWRLDALLDG